MSTDLLPEGADLLRMLVVFAGWRRCSGCGELVLYVDSRCSVDDDFACGYCQHRSLLLALDASWHHANRHRP